ncbi:unnamed protein product [Microthlaspi erraticum]|uniref:Uncharacterized protein n=1 Tax=Microthlaspi erraticum TaxID=1685480 RepID=A0A6D2IXM0_9BRAS|nr:unnamed protein product [Microthlaspi erraticum]
MNFNPLVSSLSLYDIVPPSLIFWVLLVIQKRWFWIWERMGLCLRRNRVKKTRRLPETEKTFGLTSGFRFYPNTDPNPKFQTRIRPEPNQIPERLLNFQTRVPETRFNRPEPDRLTEFPVSSTLT